MSLKHLISMDAENILFAKGILTLNRHSQSNSGLIDDQNNLARYVKQDLNEINKRNGKTSKNSSDCLL